MNGDRRGWTIYLHLVAVAAEGGARWYLRTEIYDVIWRSAKFKRNVVWHFLKRYDVRAKEKFKSDGCVFPFFFLSRCTTPNDNRISCDYHISHEPRLRSPLLIPRKRARDNCSNGQTGNGKPRGSASQNCLINILTPAHSRRVLTTEIFDKFTIPLLIDNLLINKH